MVIRISLLGPAEIKGPCGTTLSACAQSLHLLAFLATRPGRAAGREMLGHSLWTEADPERLRARLNTALWRLRKLVVDAGFPADRVLDCAAETVVLKADAPIWLDVEELRNSWRLARTTNAKTLSADAARTLAEAARLYRGTFLAGNDEDWCLIERESLTAAYQAILDRLLDHHAAESSWRAVIDTARKMLAIDPLLEHAHRATIRAHGALGERAQAARQFRRCQVLLTEELDVAPLPETEDALRRALAAVPKTLEQRGRAASASGRTSLSTIIGDLKATLKELERLNGTG